MRSFFSTLAMASLLALGAIFFTAPANATIAFVQVAKTTLGTAVSSVTINYTAAQNAGDLNVVIVGWEDATANVTSVTDTKGNTYALAVGPTRSPTHNSLALYYAKNIAAATAGANTVTVTFNTAAAGPDIRIAEYSGIDTASPLDASNGSTGTGTAVTTASMTTTFANELIVGGDQLANSTNAVGTGFTQRVLTAHSHVLEDRIVTSTGSYAVSATQSAGGYWTMVGATFRAPVADTQAPSVPSGLTATAASSSQINLSWTASTDNVAVTGYLVERCQGASCTTFTQIATPTGTTFNDTSLAASTTYRYRVRAQDAVPNLSGYSSIANATTQAASDTQAPTAPTGLTATATSSTQINLSWTASTDNVGVTGYRVERCQGAGCSTFTQIATPTGTTFSDTALTAFTTYSYRVRAADAVPNLSAYSSTASATTQVAPDTQAPTAPTGLTATTISSSQINLSWTASTDNVGVTGYRVERCQGAGCSTFTQIATPTSTSFSDTGLTASTSYSYRVRAADAVPNLSAYSSTASATTQAAGDIQAPTAPSGLTATAASSVQVDLSWTGSTDNVGVTGYVVERCAVSNCTFAAIRTLTGTQYSDLTVSGSTAYTYRVRAKDAANNLSPYSNTSNATSSGGIAAVTTTYIYDDGARLRTVSTSGNSTTYTLDPAGNRKNVATAAAAGALQFQQPTYSTAETGTVNVLVNRSVADGGAVSVQYTTADGNGSSGNATAPADYTATSGTLTWADGDATPKTISVPIAPDSILEGNETFRLILSNPVGAVLGSLTQTTVTILDDDGVGVSIASISVNENAGSAAVVVTKSGTSAVTNTVNYASANGSAAAGTDYTAVSGTLTFAPTDTTQTITVPIANDGAYKGNRSFSIGLSAPTNGASIVTGTSAVTIVEDDAQPVFAINSASGNEGATLVFTVTRTGSLAASNNVNYATSNGSAVAGNYTPTSGTLVFAPGDASQSIVVGTAGDGLYNNALTFSLGLSAPTNFAALGASSGSGTIFNVDAPPVFTLSGPALGGVLEGSPLAYSVTKTGASALTHTLNYATSDGTAVAPGDYTAMIGTLSFGAGGTSSQTVNVPTLQEGTAEAVESLSFAIGSPSSGASISGSASVSSIIVDADSAPPAPTLCCGHGQVNPGANFAMSWNGWPGDTHYVLLENQSVSGGTFTPAPESPVTGIGTVLSRSSSGNYRFEVEACRGSLCSAPSNVVTVIVCLPRNC